MTDTATDTEYLEAHITNSILETMSKVGNIRYDAAGIQRIKEAAEKAIGPVDGHLSFDVKGWNVVIAAKDEIGKGMLERLGQMIDQFNDANA